MSDPQVITDRQLVSINSPLGGRSESTQPTLVSFSCTYSSCKLHWFIAALSRRSTATVIYKFSQLQRRKGKLLDSLHCAAGVVSLGKGEGTVRPMGCFSKKGEGISSCTGYVFSRQRTKREASSARNQFIFCPPATWRRKMG